jgi:hypothetical protein
VGGSGVGKGWEVPGPLAITVLTSAVIMMGVETATLGGTEVPKLHAVRNTARNKLKAGRFFIRLLFLGIIFLYALFHAEVSHRRINKIRILQADENRIHYGFSRRFDKSEFLRGTSKQMAQIRAIRLLPVCALKLVAS